MGRLSRSEAQGRTRQLLLDAAEDAFADRGFAGASLEQIAAAAGLTRGAVYSNFADKTDLFFAVLERKLERQVAEVGGAIRDAGDPAGFVAALRGPAWRRPTEEQRRWVLLYDEFRLFALRNPGAAERLAAYERHERDSYVEAATFLLGQLGVEPPADLRLIAAVIFALDESLVRQHLVDPDDVPDGAFADALALLLEAAVALARART